MENESRPRIIMIAGTNSGCGKTTVTLGLLAALRNKGYKVQSYKAGPDFIDPGLHGVVLGRASHNLDLWMMGEKSVRDVLNRTSGDADIIVIEGAMGLFDGIRGDSEEASNAQLAKLLGAGVLLVVDASGMGRSIGAQIKGYVEFDPDLTFTGLVINRVGSDRHSKLIATALASNRSNKEWGLPSKPWLAGMIGRSGQAHLSSRHLGLVTAEDDGLTATTLSSIGSLVEESLDIDGLVQRMAVFEGQSTLINNKTAIKKQQTISLGIAADKAFCFYYEENKRLFETAGCKLRFFSPLADTYLPENCSLIYLGGGYPELHAKKLAANEGMRGSIRSFSERGGVIYGECGGFMYLLDSIMDKQGAVWPMCGVLPGSCRMMDRFQALGYREICTLEKSLLGEAATVVRGHEFHYSKLDHLDCGDGEIQAIYKLRDKEGWMNRAEGFTRNNVLASYIHLHFGSNPEALANLVEAGRRSGVTT